MDKAWRGDWALKSLHTTDDNAVIRRSRGTFTRLRLLGLATVRYGHFKQIGSWRKQPRRHSGRNERATERGSVAVNGSSLREEIRPKQISN